MKVNASVFACNFCGRLETQVELLVAGNSSTHICDSCIGICQEILDERKKESKPSVATKNECNYRNYPHLPEARL